VGDFVGVPYHHREETPVEGSEGTVVRVIAETRYRTERIGYPERCKSCNARYALAKRAREAGLRLEMVRKAQPGAKWEHLKFVTCTWPSEWCDSPEPDLKAFKKMFAAARAKVVGAIGAAGGTDVIEVVTKHDETTGKWKHHIHTHGLWCAPFVPMEALQAAFSEAGIGRFEYTVLRERVWETSGGEARVKPAIWCAIDYLAKYLSKASDAKRQVWGELRSWKDYLHEGICRRCVKTTRQAQDYKQCNCKSETHVRAD
jgi:hypothetical protein